MASRSKVENLTNSPKRGALWGSSYATSCNEIDKQEPRYAQTLCKKRLRDWLGEVEWCLPWNRRRLRDAWRWPHVFWINIFGWWGEDAGWPFFKRWLPRLRLAVLGHAVLFTLAMVVASLEKFAKGDIMTNMFTVFASGIATTGFFKMFQIVIHRRQLKAAMDSLDEMLEEVRPGREEAALRGGFRRAWAVFVFSLVSGSCVTLHWLTRPLLLAGLYSERTRIVDTWPVMIDDWRDFAISYAFQSPGVCSIGHSFYLFDNVYLCLSQCILSHFEVLRIRLGELSLGEEKSWELAACIRYHNKILRTCGLLRDASTNTIMFQCINTVVMACSGVFVITMSDELDPNVLMNLIEILLIITVVLYSYCWYSNEMTFQCGEVMRAAYMASWAGGGVGNQRTLLTLTTRTLQPVRFGGILKIDLATFITVLKTIFSYYNFLMAVAKSSTDTH